MGNGSTVSDDSAYQNGGDGISGGVAVTLTDNASYDNGDATLPASDDGIQSGSGCIVRANTARGNSGYGLNLSTDAAYSDNVVTNKHDRPGDRPRNRKRARGQLLRGHGDGRVTAAAQRPASARHGAAA